MTSSWAKKYTIEALNTDVYSEPMFHLLWQKHLHESEESCHNIAIVDTILYQYKKPNYWYFTSRQDSNIRRKKKPKLRTSQVIHDALRAGGKEEWDVVAYRCWQESTQKMAVEFYTRADVEHHLSHFNEKPGDGFIQFFVEPKDNTGQPHNFMIQVTWTPSVTFAERRVNRYRLDDPKIDALTRAITYEGELQNSDPDSVLSQALNDQLKLQCEQMAAHITHLFPKARVKTLIANFKVDKNDKIWFLWVSSLRVIEEYVDHGPSLALPPKDRFGSKTTVKCPVCRKDIDKFASFVLNYKTILESLAPLPKEITSKLHLRAPPPAPIITNLDDSFETSSSATQSPRNQKSRGREPFAKTVLKGSPRGAVSSPRRTSSPQKKSSSVPTRSRQSGEYVGSTKVHRLPSIDQAFEIQEISESAKVVMDPFQTSSFQQYSASPPPPPSYPMFPSTPGPTTINDPYATNPFLNGTRTVSRYGPELARMHFQDTMTAGAMGYPQMFPPLVAPTTAAYPDYSSYSYYGYNASPPLNPKAPLAPIHPGGGGGHMADQSEMGQLNSRGVRFGSAQNFDVLYSAPASPPPPPSQKLPELAIRASEQENERRRSSSTPLPPPGPDPEWLEALSLIDTIPEFLKKLFPEMTLAEYRTKRFEKSFLDVKSEVCTLCYSNITGIVTPFGRLVNPDPLPAPLLLLRTPSPPPKTSPILDFGSPPLSARSRPLKPPARLPPPEIEGKPHKDRRRSESLSESPVPPVRPVIVPTPPKARPGAR